MAARGHNPLHVSTLSYPVCGAFTADLPGNSAVLVSMDYSPQDLISCHPIGRGTQVYLPPPLRRSRGGTVQEETAAEFLG